MEDQVRQQRLLELENIIRKDYSNIAGMVVMKDGEVTYEQYFHQCHATSKLHVYSVSKSVISLLIGIAIEKGFIKDVQQKVLDFFPEYHVKKKREAIQHIIVKDLLTMRVPYRYKESFLTYIRYFRSDDWVNFSLSLLDETSKVGNFRYTPLIGPDLLSGILVKATGRSVLEFATEYLFAPLDIHVEKSIQFQSIKEQQAFQKATDISGWVRDRQGVHAAGWGLTLSAMDMAKIGQLYLNQGRWQERQIVSSNWIQESLCEYSRWEEMDLAYGYLWWILDEQKKIFVAMGDGGNAIYCDATKGLVISIVSHFKPKITDRIEFIQQQILPIFI